MGKKTKIGKQRKDKFYRLAKEAGLRSRAVFKLSQLNRKFEFLQKSHVLIDLCAAPGGWLQVAAKHMPTSSLIIGVDLAPIRPMNNIITLQNDITTDNCRQEIKAQLQTWLADCVLHDGAPNVGKNWGHDAFMQAQLTLSALRLATEVLKRGGWFVTKVFRSKDHPALVEVFKKLFKKVYVTKPEASRLESAEIYVVCRGYLKPDKVDAALLDPKSVFIELNLEPEKPKLNLMHPEKRRKKAEGYTEGDYTQHHRIMAKQFMESDHHLDLLADTNQIVFDANCATDQLILGHKSTTDEIKSCCADIKVLGRRELRELLNWRKKVRQHLKSLQSATGVELKNELPETEEADEEVELDNYVSALKAEERGEAKKKRRKLMTEKRKHKQKLDLKMVIPGDRQDYADEMDLFSLKKLKNREKSLGEMDIGSASECSSDAEFDAGDLSDVDFDDIGDLPISSFKHDGNNRIKSDEPLLVDFDNEDDEHKSRRKTDAWFEKEIFNDLVGDDDEDVDIEQALSTKKSAKCKASSSSARANETTRDEKSDGKSDPEKDYSAKSGQCVDQDEDDDDDFEVVPVGSSNLKKNFKLNAEGLALADLWLHSTKTRRNLVDSAYNRFTNNDESLPEWFVCDEKKHYRSILPISKEAVEDYKRRMKEIDARPIKKVAQAKARKKKRGVRRAEKAKKRAEAVVENSDMTEAQKAQEMRKIYKQCMDKQKKPEISYVVAKKGQAGKRVRRPAGVQGRFRVVDPRLKKDNRQTKRSRR